MNYFGLFFSFMVPGIIIGVMIVVACIQERAIHKRRSANVKNHPSAVVRNYAPVHKSAPVNPTKSDGSKLYIYDMNAA